MRVLVLTRYCRKGASSRLRSYQYLDFFARQANNQLTFEALPLFNERYLADLYKNKKRSLLGIIKSYSRFLFNFSLKRTQSDLIFVEKELLPYCPAWLELLLLKNKKFIVDYDDAVFHNYNTHSSWLVRKLLGGKISRIMARANITLAGNAYLADYAVNAGCKRVELFPTVIDLDRYPLITKVNNGIPVIGWIGTPTTQKFLLSIHEALKSISIPYELWIIGGHELFRLEGVPCKIKPWSEAIEVETLSQINIGIMPLDDKPFERGKCGYKLIQYMGCAKPVVASPVGVNKEIVNHGQNGYLAQTQEEWRDYLIELLLDPNKCYRLGLMGRKKVEEKYVLQKSAEKLIRFYREILCVE